MNTRKVKKIIIKCLPYAIFAYAGNIMGYAYRNAEGDDISEKITPFFDGLGSAFARIIPSFHPIDIVVGIGFALIFALIFYMKSLDKKKFRSGEEYGSARWGKCCTVKCRRYKGYFWHDFHLFSLVFCAAFSLISGVQLSERE